MPILLGVRPGGRNSFALNVIYWTGHLPARLIVSRSESGVDAVLARVMGVVGEWGELTAGVVDAPLTWGGSATGWREVDNQVKELAPKWAPSSWFRSPNSLSGAVAIQGPALTWAMAVESKQGNLPGHRIYETHSRVSMARTCRGHKDSVLKYRDAKSSAKTREKHVKRIVDHYVDAGIIHLETEGPKNPEELEAMICAVTAAAIAFPDTGLVCHEFKGGDIRPVGTRNLVILDALP